MEKDPRQEEETSEEVRKWFEAHPEEKDTLSLPMSEKKGFILMYYSEDVNSEKLLEEMLEEAEKAVDKELAAGHGKHPFSEELIVGMLTLAKGKVVDELITDVERLYEERRRLVKGKEIKDPGVIKLTQLNCSKLAHSMQMKILKQVEEEAKSRDMPLEEFMYLCVVVASNDLQTFVDIERLYNYRKTEEARDKPFDVEKVKEYIRESLKISEQILTGELDSTVVFLYPHLLSDRLFNLTGFESEQVVGYIRKMVKDDTIDEELANLIVREAYSVEKSKESCHQTFDNQMMNYERQIYEAYERQQREVENVKNPLDDRAVKKMIETGMMNQKDAEEIIKQHRINSQQKGFAPPGMYIPGMVPGFFPQAQPTKPQEITVTKE